MSEPIDITPACECGALVHPGETCEAALACLEAMLAGCTCGGHYDADRRVVEHETWCDLVFWTDIGPELATYWPAPEEHDGAHVFAGPCEAVS